MLALGLGTALAAAAGSEGERVYVVEPGETLSRIAARVAGDPGRWPEIYRANRDQIKDPSLLYPGQRLAIPDFQDPPRSEPERAPQQPPER